MKKFTIFKLNYLGAPFLPVYLILMTFFVLPHVVLAGGQGSGGGNDLKARFVTLSNQLLENGPLSDEDKKLLKSALEKSDIETVQVLLDLSTGKPPVDIKTHKPIPQNQLLAWSQKDSIQLKEASPDPNDASFTDLIFKRKPIAHELAHELFRATGLVTADNKSIDDNYQLSVGKYHLDQWPLYLPDLPNNGRLKSRECPKGIIMRGVDLFDLDSVNAAIRANNTVQNQLEIELQFAKNFHDWLSAKIVGADVVLDAGTGDNLCRNDNYIFAPPFIYPDEPVATPYIRTDFSVEFPWQVGISEESKYYLHTFEFGVPAYFRLSLAHQMGDESPSTIIYLGTVNYFDVK